jgi:ATP-dependent exoDNAse (exonuclease V) beta subunit
VVLHGLNRFTGSPLGVSVARDIDGFDFAAPLAGRWVRFWPQPYAAKNNGLPFHTRLAAHPATVEAEAREARQELRVLYVGWTRARDRLVISTRAGALTKGLLELLQEGGVPLVNEPTPSATWAGRVVTATLRCPAPLNPVVRDSEPGAGFDAPGPAAHPPAFRRPSDFDHAGAVIAHTRLGPHLTLTGNPEMAALGEAVHGFLAADRADLDPAQRHSLAEGLLGRWSVAGALPPKDLLDASDRLQGWVAQRWPDARWCREWPLAHPLEDGSGVRGFSDLVLDTEAGLVVVDHKSTPGREADVVEAAAGHAGQLGAYADSVSAATGRPVIGCFVHLPVAGVVVEVSRG